MFDSVGLEVLDSGECMRLLAGAPIGRVVFTDRVCQHQPVNFTIHNDSVIIPTRPGSKLAAASRNTIMAFEVDDIDPV